MTKSLEMVIAKYTSKDLYGYQETFEDVYDQDGNLIMTVEL